MKVLTFKRLLDISLSSVALIVFLPLGLPLAVVLKLTGEGDVFYLQTRVGLHGKEFSLFKFATMLRNSPNIGSGDITVSNDPRVLPVGRFLRKTKLNEVPQVLNILAGSMSIVGPRPLTPRNFAYYNDQDKEIIGLMRPGLTGIGSIVFRDEERILSQSQKPFDQCYKEDIAPYKAELERWYYKHQGVVTDLIIIAVTAWVVMRPGSTVYRKLWKDLPPAPPGLFGHSA